MTALTCDSCDETADGVQPAIAHVTSNPGHRMGAEIDDEGTTVTVSVDEPDYEDEGDVYYGEADWGDE